MVIRAFITHKKAEAFADCQDRFGVNGDTKSIAVSDGMGSTWQQKIWAQLLVDTFTESADWQPKTDSIKPLCQIWRNKVLDFIQQLKDTNAPENIIYRNERNLAGGRSAGATFLGIRFNEKQWSGVVLGDSCLIEWDGEKAIFHTSQDVEAFDSFPDYFDSDVTKEGKGTPKNIAGELSDGKCLLLVSDPFSDFLLEHQKQGDIAEYAQKILSVSSHADFELLVDDWRTKGMHNDDTTLVVVENDNSDSFAIVEQDDINAFIKKDKLEKKEKTEADGNQIISEKEQEKEKKEMATDSNCNSIPVDKTIVMNELKNELKEKGQSLEKQSLMGWWNIINKAHKKVLGKYVIFKK